jgi:hypothetical protein
VAPAAKMHNRELVIQAESFLADPMCLPHYRVWDGNRGFGHEMRVAASDLRLSLTFDDVRPNTSSFSGISVGGLVRIFVDGQVALERREVGSWSNPEPT